jgi:hypothetical protein
MTVTILPVFILINDLLSLPSVDRSIAGCTINAVNQNGLPRERLEDHRRGDSKTRPASATRRLKDGAGWTWFATRRNGTAGGNVAGPDPTIL